MKKIFLAACLMVMIAVATNAKDGKATPGKVNILHTDEFVEMFDEKCKIERPIVIDFSAEWCGWCKKMHPHIQELAKKYSGKIDFYQVNYETDIELIQAIGIQSYPTLVYVKTDGSVLIDEDGYRTTEVLDSTIQEVFYNK